MSSPPTSSNSQPLDKSWETPKPHAHLYPEASVTSGLEGRNAYKKMKNTPPSGTINSIESPPTARNIPTLTFRRQIHTGISKRSDFPIHPSLAAILVIDIQQYLSPDYSGNTAPAESYFSQQHPKAVANIHSLLQVIRKCRDDATTVSGSEVIFTYLQAATSDRRDISIDYRLSGMKLSRIPNCHAIESELFLAGCMPDAEHGKGDILVPKTSCSVFMSTNINYLLRNLGIEQIVMVGQLTNQCVESTVRDAADLGYLVTVVEDACVALSPEEHERGLTNMKGFARIVSTAMVFDEWDRNET